MKSSILALLVGTSTLFTSTYAASEPYPEYAVKLRDAGYKTMTLQGCYSSIGDMVKANVSIYNTQGSCQEHCVSITGGTRHPVLATQDQTCFCGDALPAASSKTDNSTCSTICPGYEFDMCGGNSAYSVWLTGEELDSTDSDSDSLSPTATPSVSSSKTTGGSASTVTKDGQTIVITAPAATAETSGSDKSSGPNKAAIAAGVVIGVVLLAAVGAGSYFFIRHRRRRQIEEEYQRNAAVSSFISGGKSPSSAGNSFNDPRIDPAVLAQRRMSDGSIADNQDYSRRILKVTNA